MDVLRKINGLFTTPVSDGADEQNKILCAQLPFTVFKYPSGAEFNGWYVPKKWEVKKALIKKNGKVVYDGMQHPLAVIGSSQSFTGTVSLEELKKHLFYSAEQPDNIVYHCDLYYKPFIQNWGFSMPHNQFLKLEEGDYEVELVTEHADGEMKVLEITHQGECEDMIIFNAHNCHAAQLNDGPAGYVVFMSVMEKLLQRKTRYTYRLVVAPEHMGTVFYLANKDPQEIKKMKLGIFMEMVGHDNPVFSLQESFTGTSYIDKVGHHVLKHEAVGYWSAGYRKFLGNDECVWEAPGYEVPMISVSRCQSMDYLYPEYHLDSDNINLMNEGRLEETDRIIMSMVDIIEKDCFLKRKFTGLIALSNPKYDLYISPGDDPSQRTEDRAEDQKRWNELMNHVFRYMEENMSILDIAIKHEVSFEKVYTYLVRFKEKGLVDFVYKKQF